jgi:hypothetical protein
LITGLAPKQDSNPRASGEYFSWFPATILFSLSKGTASECKFLPPSVIQSRRKETEEVEMEEQNEEQRDRAIVSLESVELDPAQEIIREQRRLLRADKRLIPWQGKRERTA